MCSERSSMQLSKTTFFNQKDVENIIKRENQFISKLLALLPLPVKSQDGKLLVFNQTFASIILICR